MNQFELAAGVLMGNLEMFKGTIADFTDAEILLRPCPGANHTAWQLGHLTAAESMMVNAVKPGTITAFPPGWEKKFNKETAGKDDPAFFPNKAQLLDVLTNVRTGTVGWVKSLTPADLDKPGPEMIRSMCPTIGHLLYLFPVHFAMHMGQMQVIRRKLGKPIMF